MRQDSYTSNGNTVTNWYDYNPAGQLISETQSHLGSGAITYDYYGPADSGAGQRPRAPRQTTFATSGTPAVQTGYQYDSAGRLWKVTSGTLEVEYGYKTGTVLVNAVTTRQGGTIVATETRTYENTTDRLKKIERKNAAGDVVYSIDYTSFSSTDQREGAEVVRRQTNNTVENQTWNWNYDPYGQLIGYTETTNEWETAYDFDEAGNRDGRGANNVNQYANRSYDGNGNQTSDGTWAYVYNALDQMVGATRLDGSERVSYAYDGQGRRVFKDTFISTDEGLNWVLSSSRKFGYDGTQLIAEYDNTTGALLRSFTWGIGIGQVGALLSISTYGTNGTVAARYIPFFDGSGNVTGLTDASGAVVATYEYSPFGNLLSSNGTTEALAANPFGFSTMYFDGETGKYHYPYREYDPVDGRWMTRDPIAESGGVNLYAFVGNDPVNQIDPNGQNPVPLNELESKWLAIFENFERGKVIHQRIQAHVVSSNFGRPVFTEVELGTLVDRFKGANAHQVFGSGLDWDMLERNTLPYKFKGGELESKRPDIVIFDGDILHVFEIKSANAGETDAIRDAKGYVRVLKWVLGSSPSAWLGNRLLPGTSSTVAYPTAYGMLTWESPSNGAILYRLSEPKNEVEQKSVSQARVFYIENTRPAIVEAAKKRARKIEEEQRIANGPQLSARLPLTPFEWSRQVEIARKDIDDAVWRGDYDGAKRLQQYYRIAFNGVEVYRSEYTKSELADLSRLGQRPLVVRIITDDPNPANWPRGFRPLYLPIEAEFGRSPRPQVRSR